MYIRYRVLFVCIENSCRSQMAEGFARFHGRQFIEAHSAGSKPSGTVHPRAIQFMKERGIDLKSHASKGLDALPKAEFDAVVTMGCGDACPNVMARIHEDWKLPDPKNLPDDEFRKVRDQIEQEVLALLKELGVPSSP